MWRKQPEIKTSFPHHPSPAPVEAHDVATTHSPPPDHAERATQSEHAEHAAPPPAAVGSETSRLGPGLRFKGQLSGECDLHIDGEVDGKIRLPQSSVTIGLTGRVAADIEARQIVVEGTLRGNLFGHDFVRLENSCHVTGEISGKRVMIQEGARFEGRVEIGQAGDANRPKSNLALGRERAVKAHSLAAPTGEEMD